MKKIITLLLVLSWHITNAQDFSDLKDVEFKTADECRAYDGKALECANYMFTHPYDKNDLNRMIAQQLVLKWMMSSADYHFSIVTQYSDISKKNDAVFALCMAGMTKFALENKDKANDANAVTLNSIQFVIDYCKIPTNNIKLTKELKKAVDAANEGKLKEYLKL